MDLIGLTLALLVVLVLIMAALGRAFQGHSVAELLDWQPTRSPEVEAQNEIDDVQQMIDAQNEMRRRRGAAEITEADVQRQAMEDQRMRARGTGPLAQGGGLLDELDGEADRAAGDSAPGGPAEGEPGGPAGRKRPKRR
ncbi:MAG: hypothetical protein ACXW0S_09525 [Solirubrobacterales bacterium]